MKKIFDFRARFYNMRPSLPVVSYPLLVRILFGEPNIFPDSSAVEQPAVNR